jgi:hypothetical protein
MVQGFVVAVLFLGALAFLFKKFRPNKPLKHGDCDKCGS